MIRNAIYLYFLIFLPVCVIQAQETAFGNQMVDEFFRRKSLIDTNKKNTGWMLRTASGSVGDLFYQRDSLSPEKKLFDYAVLPIYFTTRLDGKRPYVGGEYGIIPARGTQAFLSTGFQARFSILYLQFQPELVIAQNFPFVGFPDSFSSGTISARFWFWNIGDSPERFGKSTYSKAFWGAIQYWFACRGF